jgi:20S proteasome subunit beta 6
VRAGLLPPLPRLFLASLPLTSTHPPHPPPFFCPSTSLGIAGADFAVLAADTRLSEGYNILTRNVSRVNVLTRHCAVATGGCHTDVSTLHKMLTTRVAAYKAAHESDMSSPAAAQLLSTTLYSRRFMPYYAFNVLGGLDAAGAGAVYTYDAVGSFERVAYAAQGAGQKLIIPLLDNIVGGKNRQDRGYGAGAPALTLAEAQQLAVEAFITAGERDMYTGDAVEVYTITAEGVSMRRVALKAD